ncbi:AsmA protein [Desulfonatronum thiosulfatophilum]|uniref:AsmA protein n=1 Tax=Desulfonatronum thiosulfatophilum TaxID=617002 RepID=A0A1G6CUS5_9BACT|nr:AsmA family protein [Desulfonatronum thiosulfatophilum]SDB36495.1 AsmA protein [Desulfonatronum thiosulfatophilum]
MKKILIIIGILVLLAVGAVVALAMLVDPNAFRPLIARQVQEATDREVLITGDLSWTFWPRLGISMGAAELGNPPGMEEHRPLLTVGSAELFVDVTPLFRKRLQVGEIVLHDVAVHVLTLDDGRSNLDNLRQPEPEDAREDPRSVPDRTEEPTPETATEREWEIVVEGLRMANAEIVIDDRQAGRTTEVRDLHLTLSRFAPGEWVSIALEGRADVDQVSMANTLRAEARLAPDFQLLELRDVKADVVARGDDVPGGSKVVAVQGEVRLDMEGRVAVIDPLLFSLDDLRLVGDLRVDYSGKPEIAAAFTADTLDLNPLLRELKNQRTVNGLNGSARPDGTSGKTEGFENDMAGDVRGQESAAASSTNAVQDSVSSDERQLSREEPDLSILESVNGQLSLYVATVLADELRLTDSRMALSLRDGQLTLQDLLTHAFAGQINLSALLDSAVAPPTYIVDLRVQGVEAQEALIALAQTNILSGTAEVAAELQGAGLSEHAVMHGLRGNLSLDFVDGALWGVNLPHEVRKVHAAFRGRTIGETDLVQKTDFTSLSGSFQIGDAKAVTQDLAMASPLLRMNGEGVLELPTKSVDMVVDVGVVGTLEGQHGREWEELKGLTIPLRISGPLSDPNFALNVDDALRQRAAEEAEKLKGKAKQELERTLRRQLGDDAEEGLGGLLKKLF